MTPRERAAIRAVIKALQGGDEQELLDFAAIFGCPTTCRRPDTREIRPLLTRTIAAAVLNKVVEGELS